MKDTLRIESTGITLEHRPTVLNLDVTYMLGIPPCRNIKLDVDEVRLVYNGNELMRLVPKGGSDG